MYVNKDTGYKCSNCGQGINLYGLVTTPKYFVDDLGAYCSERCQKFFHYPRFCDTCMDATTYASAGSTYTLNGCGIRLYDFREHQCPVCGAFVQRKFFCIFFIPIIPLGKYLFKWATSDRYISRKLK